MAPSTHEIWDTYSACVRFCVHEVAPAVLAHIGEHDLAERMANVPLGREGGNAVMAVERASAELLGARMHLALRDHDLEGKFPPDKDLPAEVREVRDALRVVVAVDEMHQAWANKEHDTSFHLMEGMAEVCWNRAKVAAKFMCSTAEPMCDGRVGQRARMLAWGVLWEDVQAHVDDLDDATLERACRLAKGTAFHHTRASYVFARAAEITDEACDEVCIVLARQGVWSDTALEAARDLPLATLHTAQVLWSAAVSVPMTREGTRRPWSSQGLFVEALEVAPTLDGDTAELAARLLASGLDMVEAVETARAAVECTA